MAGRRHLEEVEVRPQVEQLRLLPHQRAGHPHIEDAFIYGMMARIVKGLEYMPTYGRGAS